jgi:Protein of unknown function (DUF3551)
MRSTFLVFSILAIPAALTISTARAYDPYPWCAVYGVSMSGSSNCGLTTWQQCMATVSGIGGSCEPNQFYNPRGSVSRSKASKKRSHYQPYHDQPTAPFGSLGSWPSYNFDD